MNEIVKIFSALIPSLLIFLTSLLFPLKNAGSEVPFRPPAYVFAIVWPILLIVFGISWYLNTNHWYLYLTITLLLCLWIIIYKYSKLFSFLELLLTIGVLFSMILIIDNHVWLIYPLLLWLIFASTLNAYQVKY